LAPGDGYRTQIDECVCIWKSKALKGRPSELLLARQLTWHLAVNCGWSDDHVRRKREKMTRAEQAAEEEGRVTAERGPVVPPSPLLGDRLMHPPSQLLLDLPERAILLVRADEVIE
jgi:hypothetical protein